MVLSRDAIWGDCSAWRELESLTVPATSSTDLIIITMASGQKVAKDFNLQSSILRLRYSSIRSIPSAIFSSEFA